MGDSNKRLIFLIKLFSDWQMIMFVQYQKVLLFLSKLKLLSPFISKSKGKAMTKEMFILDYQVCADVHRKRSQGHAHHVDQQTPRSRYELPKNGL